MSSSKISSVRWRIALSNDAARAYKHFSLETAKRINTAFDKLALNPLAEGVVAIKSKHGVYRLRIGDLRILFGLNKTDRIIEIYAIVKRGEAYRRK